MLSRELMRQFRRLRWQARRRVQTLAEGHYQSAFRGRGLSFEEVREYQPGDDIRSIDWNVTARAGSPFVKRFVEERELTVLLVCDLSGSLRYGSGPVTKRRALGEAAALVALSAAGNGDRVGLIAGGDRAERLLPPGKGLRHTLRVLRDVLFFEPASAGTSLAALLDRLNRVRRRAVAFLMSDFLDPGDYRKPFERAGRFHDLIAFRVTDPRESELPPAGLVAVEDAETGRQRLVDTSSPRLRRAYAAAASRRGRELRELARSAGADYVEAAAGGHLDALARLFRSRRLRRPR